MTPLEDHPAEGPLVTVVIPLYNGGTYVGETLRSVLAQSFARFEVIVVDDGSTDDGPDVVRSFESDPRVRLVTGAHLGVAAARNDGAGRASTGTPYLAFLDADDVWHPELLATLVGALEGRADAAGAFVLAEYIDADGAVLHAGDFPRHMRGRLDLRDGKLVSRDVHADVGPEHLFLSNLVYPPSCLLLRRIAFDAVGGFDDRFLAEDWEFVLRLAGRGPLVPVDRVMVGYRRHTANASGDRARNVRGARQVWASVFHRPHASVETRRRLRAVWRAHQSRTTARKVAEGRALLARGRIIPGAGRIVDGLAHTMLRRPLRVWAPSSRPDSDRGD
ncbi:glycosyltransferase family 2 protein [Agromyces sp. GXQ0307]|uniref:glycosyltransferase family 2 protein n=1 Tax=Agromyces sp. GXQ0307 TaxID=3377835 RepID=UPI00383AFFB9